jgi:hypothetical protein
LAAICSAADTMRLSLCDLAFHERTPPRAFSSSGGVHGKLGIM